MKSGLVFVIGESLGIGQDVIPLYLLLTLSHVQCFSITRIIVFLCHIILHLHYSLVNKLYFNVFSW